MEYLVTPYDWRHLICPQVADSRCPVTFSGARSLVTEGQIKEAEVNCPTCHGKGVTKCERCGGSGVVSTFPSTVKCGTCEGKGQVVCANCNGKGQVFR